MELFFTSLLATILLFWWGWKIHNKESESRAQFRMSSMLFLLASLFLISTLFCLVFWQVI
jgi:hypothetical protein